MWVGTAFSDGCLFTYKGSPVTGHVKPYSLPPPHGHLGPLFPFPTTFEQLYNMDPFKLVHLGSTLPHGTPPPHLFNFAHL